MKVVSKSILCRGKFSRFEHVSLAYEKYVSVNYLSQTSVVEQQTTLKFGKFGGKFFQVTD